MGLVQALKRQTGVKNAVVDFKKGTANVTWKKNTPLDYDALKRAVNKSSDMTFKSLTLVVQGEVTEQAGKPVLTVTGTKERFLLGSDAKAAGQETPLAKLTAAVAKGAKAVTVTGRVQESPKPALPNNGKAGEQPLTLLVERFETGTVAR